MSTESDRKAQLKYLSSKKGKAWREEYVIREEVKKKAVQASLKWKHNNIHKFKDSYYKREYGITYADFLFLKRIQSNKCVICNQKETFTKNGKILELAVDHCHVTGRIRGLLCRRCNVVLGLLRDNIEHLQNMTSYLLLSEKDSDINTMFEDVDVLNERILRGKIKENKNE